MDLTELGWNEFFEKSFEPLKTSGLTVGRVAVQLRGGFVVYSDQGDMRAEVSGRFRHQAKNAGQFPAIGDWVAMEVVPERGKALIQHVLPRRSKFSRNNAGDTTNEQVVAANIDDVFLVESLASPLNIRRIERFLTLGWESGANPVILLTKADLCKDVAGAVAEAENVASGQPVHAVSGVTGKGIKALNKYLTPGRTVALLGPSGVGKSTLINSLIGDEMLPTIPVRESDQKGRHTTTIRELISLPKGGLIIDTPGMRELQLWNGNEGLLEAFSDIESIATQCRFADCQHQSEPECAVSKAIKNGSLAADRLESFRKLKGELAHFSRKHNLRTQAEERRRLKSIMRGMRENRKYMQ